MSPTTTTRSPAEGIYRRTSVRMWGDERFLRLSPLQPSGQALWIYLLSGPHTGPIPGVFVVGRASLAESLGWTAEAFDEAFAEVIAEGLAQFDAKTRMWFIPNALKHNFSANPNVVRSWRMQWSLLPECEMRNQVYECLKAALHGLSEAFGNAFEESCGKALGKALPKHSPKQEAGSRKQDRGTREPRGTSLPTDWKPSSEDIGYAEKHGVNVTVESEKFVNYFSTLTGKGSVRKGWSPSWRTWCLKSLEFRQNGHAARPADLDDMFRRGAQ